MRSWKRKYDTGRHATYGRVRFRLIKSFNWVSAGGNLTLSSSICSVMIFQNIFIENLIISNRLGTKYDYSYSITFTLVFLTSFWLLIFDFWMNTRWGKVVIVIYNCFELKFLNKLVL